MCLVVCFMLLLVVCCHLANKDIYITADIRLFVRGVYGCLFLQCFDTVGWATGRAFGP